MKENINNIFVNSQEEQKETIEKIIAEKEIIVFDEKFYQCGKI